MGSDRTIRLIGRLALAGLFLFSGVQKVLGPERFTESIVAYEVVSRPVAVLLAFYLPWLEIVLAIGLLIRGWRRAASYALASLLLVFTLAICLVWLRGLPLDCGCFGDWWSGAKSPAWSVARNTGLILLLVVLEIGDRGLAGLRRVSRPVPEPLAAR